MIALWRDIVRSTNNIEDLATRTDMRQFARVEFEQHRHVTDLVCTSDLHYAVETLLTINLQDHIRYLLSVRPPCTLATRQPDHTRLARLNSKP